MTATETSNPAIEIPAKLKGNPVVLLSLGAARDAGLILSVWLCTRLHYAGIHNVGQMVCIKESRPASFYYNGKRIKYVGPGLGAELKKALASLGLETGMMPEKTFALNPDMRSVYGIDGNVPAPTSIEPFLVDRPQVSPLNDGTLKFPLRLTPIFAVAVKHLPGLQDELEKHLRAQGVRLSGEEVQRQANELLRHNALIAQSPPTAVAEANEKTSQGEEVINFSLSLPDLFLGEVKSNDALSKEIATAFQGAALPEIAKRLKDHVLEMAPPQ